MTIHHRHGLVIVTEYQYPPIPIRKFDWSAVLDDYDGSPSDPMGAGANEEEAIADLLEQIDDANDEQLRYETEMGAHQ